jgi:serine/threonine-protein kinase
VGGSRQRLVSGARYAWWRGDRDSIRSMREQVIAGQVFAPALIANLMDAFLDGKWPSVRDELLAMGFDITPPSRRRRAFVAQLVAEGAGMATDVDTCNDLIRHAIDQGLFDLHWLDKCPMLGCVRDTHAFAKCRAIVKARAEAILDALYGDHGQHTILETQISLR